MSTDRSNQAISDLVVSYSAYMSAIKERRHQAIVTWAMCLLGDQKTTGVEMIPAATLELDIKTWKSK